MSLSVAPLIVSLVLTNRIRKYVRVNMLRQWERPFQYAMIFAISLFAVEIVSSAVEFTKWIWHLFLILLIVFALRQNELRALRGYMLAFLPYIIVALLGDLTQVVASGFFNDNEQYFKNAIALSFIWMVAILYSQNRQLKAAEKERIKREQEDELNRAIAIRKVELEGLVAERTAELTEQKEELEHTLHELRSTQSQLIQSEKMASLGELTAGIAHEIQNPLNFVNNFSEINIELIEEMKTELLAGNNVEAIEIVRDISENMEKITQHGKRADAIVKGMLQHSRSSSGVKEPTDINALADEYLRLAYHGLRAKDKSFHATINTEFDDSIGTIIIIPQDIGRVLLNLINNAFYAMNEKKSTLELESSANPAIFSTYVPTVSIRTFRTNGNVSISVKDNGNGIPKHIVDKIFQPFFTTKPTGQGTGLGLSMSYDIIKAHGGEIKVETIEGEQTEFTIQLNGVLLN